MCCQMRRAHGDQRHNHDHRWRSERDRQTARVFWSKPINEPEEEQHADRRERDVVLQEFEPENVFRAGNDIRQTRPAAQRCRHREISDEEQCTNHGEQPALRTGRGINAAAIRKVSANDGVIDSDQTGEHADGKDNRQRRKPGCEKCEPNHVGLARAPVAVQQRGRAFPINIARPMHRAALGDNQVSHRKWKPDCSSGSPVVTSGFLNSIHAHSPKWCPGICTGLRSIRRFSTAPP